MDKNITVNGREYTTTSDAWWLTKADGDVVARIYVLKHNDNKNYCIDLADDDLVANKLIPGIFKDMQIIAGARPKGNKKP